MDGVLLNGFGGVGHALNKVLKDFINRYKASRGYRVKYVVGKQMGRVGIELSEVFGGLGISRDGTVMVYQSNTKLSKPSGYVPCLPFPPPSTLS